MSKYKVGDKVIIRKDLVVGERYGGLCWLRGMEFMKNEDYVVIVFHFSDYDSDYRVKGGWNITADMIEGLYEGDNK